MRLGSHLEVAARSHRVKTLPRINYGIVCSHNEAASLERLWHSRPCGGKQKETGAGTSAERKDRRQKKKKINCRLFCEVFRN